MFESSCVDSPLEEEVEPSYKPPEPLYQPESKPEPRGTNTNILLTIPLILAPGAGERNLASCSLSQKERNVEEAFNGQRKPFRQLKRTVHKNIFMHLDVYDVDMQLMDSKTLIK